MEALVAWLAPVMVGMYLCFLAGSLLDIGLKRRKVRGLAPVDPAPVMDTMDNLVSIFANNNQGMLDLAGRLREMLDTSQ